jgi:glycosyltransferase involved in cell wall biosynthesis
MKVLFVTKVLPHSRVYSGFIVIHHRIRLLAERGWQVGLASFCDPEETAGMEEMRGLVAELETLSPPPPLSITRKMLLHYGPGYVPSPLYQVTDPRMGELVGRMVERSHYDAVIAEFTGMGQYLYWNVHLPAVRRIVSVHSSAALAFEKAIEIDPYSASSVWKRLALPRLRQYEISMYRNADMIVTLTEEERQNILKMDPNIRIEVSPYGVDTDRFHPTAEGEAGREESIVFTGFYKDEPNLDAVLWFSHTVWPKLRKMYPALKFYIVGSNPPSEIQDLARRDPGIIVTGEVADVAPYLARSRLYVCPMRMGTGFCGKILQAMAAGLPVVATSRSAEGLSLEPGYNIMLADTPHIMLENISLLLTDRALRKRLSDRALAMVRQRFNWSRCVDSLENAIREAVT